MIKDPKKAEPDQQRDEHIAHGAEQQGIGNLGNGGEQGQAFCVAPYAGGVAIAFAQQVGHDGEREAARHVQPHGERLGHRSAEDVRDVVARHARNSRDLQGECVHGGLGSHGDPFTGADGSLL